MSAKDIKPDRVQAWLEYAQRNRDRATALGAELGQCEHGHYDCAPVWGGTCVEEVKDIAQANT